SLVIEFTLEMKDSAFRTRQEFDGVFRLLREPTGDILASYELRDKHGKEGAPPSFSGLLNAGTIYVLDHGQRTAVKYRPKKGDVPRTLEDYLNPFILLLDRKRAQDKWRLAISKQNDWYACLRVEPKGEKRSSWSWEGWKIVEKGQLVVMNKATATVPK